MDPLQTGIDVALRDGRTVHVRTIQTTDEGEILQAFGRMSAEARYMRFMRVVKEPNLERLHKALAAFPESGTGIVATVPAADGIDIVGSAIFVIGQDRSSCEFAINVDSNYGGTGLGRALMTTLIEEATRRGLIEMEGFVLTENKPMLRLASRLGFKTHRDPDDASVQHCRLSLRPG